MARGKRDGGWTEAGKGGENGDISISVKNKNKERRNKQKSWNRTKGLLPVLYVERMK